MKFESVSQFKECIHFKHPQIDVRIKIRLLITATWSEVKRRWGIEFVDRSNDSDERQNLTFFEQSAIVYKRLLILFKTDACLKKYNGFKFPIIESTVWVYAWPGLTINKTGKLLAVRLFSWGQSSNNPKQACSQKVAVLLSILILISCPAECYFDKETREKRTVSSL